MEISKQICEDLNKLVHVLYIETLVDRMSIGFGSQNSCDQEICFWKHLLKTVDQRY